MERDAEREQQNSKLGRLWHFRDRGEESYVLQWICHVGGLLNKFGRGEFLKMVGNNFYRPKCKIIILIRRGSSAPPGNIFLNSVFLLEKMC